MLAEAKIGAAIVPLNTTLPVHTITHNLLFTKVKFLISWHSVLNKILINNKFKKIFKNKLISVGSQISNCEYFQDLIKEKKLFKKIEFKVSNESAWEVGLACGGEIAIFLEQIH